jgi:hypothetical protein
MSEFLETTLDKFTFRVATDRLYTEGHLWVRWEDGLARIGLSDYVQQLSGDVAFAEPEPVGIVEIGEEHGGMCFADGVQCATGCTFGKGNIHKQPYGKLAFTLIDKATNRAVRISYRPTLQKQICRNAAWELCRMTSRKRNKWSWWTWSGTCQRTT